MAAASDNGLVDKVVVVTGASSGIGRGTAQEFARAGATVVLAARRGYVLEQMAHDFESAGYRALALAVDVSKSDEVEVLAQTVIERFGRIDVWVNNAGVGVVGRFEEVPLKLHEQVIQTNLLGAMYGCYHALRHFRSRQQGVLINVSSMFGKLPGPYWSSYIASKFALNGFGDALRQELRLNQQRNIHVCTVLPMTTDTPFFAHAGNYTGREIGLPNPIHDPQLVIDTIVRLATEPEDEVIIGNAGRLVNAVHNLVPGAIENLFGSQAHRLQFDNTSPAQTTSGAVQQPMQVGTQVEGGHLRKSA